MFRCNFCEQVRDVSELSNKEHYQDAMLTVCVDCENSDTTINILLDRLHAVSSRLHEKTREGLQEGCKSAYLYDIAILSNKAETALTKTPELAKFDLHNIAGYLSGALKRIKAIY